MSTAVPDARIRTVTQAQELQRIAYNEAVSLRDIKASGLSEAVSKANALKSLGLLWHTAKEAVRVAKGKPLPGSLRPKAKERKRNPNRTGQANGHAEPQGPASPEPLAEPMPKPTENSST